MFRQREKHETRKGHFNDCWKPTIPKIWDPACENQPKKLTVFKLLKIAKPENRIFFLGKKIDTQDGSHKPSIFFWNQEPTQFSHRAKKKRKNRNQRFSKNKSENRPTLVWMYTMEVLVHLPASQVPKKRHILCAHTQRGWGGLGWPYVNPIVLLMRIDSVLGLWTSINGHCWESSGKNAHKIHVWKMGLT